MTETKKKQASTKNKKKTDATIIVAIIGLIGTLATAFFASPVLIALIQNPSTPTSISTLPTLPIPSPTLTAPQSNVLFSLENAEANDFYIVKKANFLILDDGSLAIQGTFSDGVFLNQSLPKNFKAKIQLQIQVQRTCLYLV